MQTPASEITGLHSRSTRGDPDRGTHVRWFILVLVTIIMAMNGLDRLSLSVIGKDIQDEFHLTTQAMGWVLGSFFLGYAFFQIPFAYISEHFGARRILTLAVLWWSFWTGAIGLIPHSILTSSVSVVWILASLRVLAGLGIAAAPPYTNKVIAFWTSPRERAMGSSSALLGTGIGGAIAPVFLAWTMQRWGWRVAIYLCALIGFVIAAGWRFYSRDVPEQHPGVNKAELELIQSGRKEKDSSIPRPTWRRLLATRSVWGLLLSYFFQGYTFYIYVSWFFIYLIRARGMTMIQSGLWSSTPFIAISVLSPVGGWVSDKCVARFGKRLGRRMAVWIGMGSAALLLVTGGHTANNTAAILLMGTAAGFILFAVASWWATCIDLTPNHSPILSASMNTCGSLGGWISPIVTGYIAASFGWTRALDVAAGVTLVSGLLWFLVDATDSLESPVGTVQGVLIKTT
ncbi:MAG: MFS transporter [Acidobacteriota bacterium]|nr:MFS transporter [Acidobacteriota bacterium]